MIEWKAVEKKHILKRTYIKYDNAKASEENEKAEVLETEWEHMPQASSS